MFALKQRVLITFTVLAAACGGESDGDRVVVGCEEDEEVGCRCADGRLGKALCESDGTVGVCFCSTGPSGAGAGGGPTDPGTGGRTPVSTTGGRASTGGRAPTGGRATTLAPTGGSPTGGSPVTGGTNGGAAPQEPGECTASSLDFQVQDADYSDSLDRVVALAIEPRAVMIVDPYTLETTPIELPLAGSSISVSPDGKQAAVAHNGYVSIVNLEEAALEKTITTSTVAGDVMMGGNGFAYVLPESDQWVAIHSIDIEAEVDLGDDNVWSIYAGTLGKLHPSGQAAYGITVGLSPTDIESYDISNGVVGTVTGSQYHGDYPMCGDIWISKDGLRIFTGCGTAFRASPGNDDDMTYNGALEEQDSPEQFYYRRYDYIAHDAFNEKVYALFSDSDAFSTPEKRVVTLRTYDYEFLSFEGDRAVPCLGTGGVDHALQGRFVFPATNGESIVVLGRAEGEGLLNDWGLAVLPAAVEP